MNQNTNVYFQARKKASLYNEKLYSREGAAELLGISVSALADYELGNTKVVPVDKVVLMADLYKCPELKNGYCKHECPIGKQMPIATEQGPLERVAIRLLTELDGEGIDEIVEMRYRAVMDLMDPEHIVGKAEDEVDKEIRQIKENQRAIYKIEKAAEHYKRWCEKSHNNEDMRRYEVMEMMYLTDYEYTVEEIASVEEISEKTLYRDLKVAVDAMSIYMLGI